MRKSKPIKLFLPQVFITKLDECLEQNPPSFNYNKLYFYYVIHYITRLELKNKRNEFISINMYYLKSVTISNIGRYIKTLKIYEFIICDNLYEPGQKSLQYKINDRFVSELTKIEIPANSRIGKKILNRLRKDKANYNNLEPHLKLMLGKFKALDMDYEGAYKWINDNATKKQILSYATSISLIEDKRTRHFKRNKTNQRLDTNLTNLKSDLRQFIKGDFVSIDIKNSQPFLLSILIDNIISNNISTLCCHLDYKNITRAFGIKEMRRFSKIHKKWLFQENMNLSLFKKSTLTGILYDDFMMSYEGNISRKEVKNIMFKVLFSRNHFYRDHRKVIPFESDKNKFKSIYPFVYEVVKILKTKNHKTLPIYLQKMESYLFIDCIAKELVANGIVPYTIHDSVIVEPEHQVQTIEIINKVFMDEIGVIPTLKVSNLKVTTNVKHKVLYAMSPKTRI